jgi:hypothetical protein
MAAKVPDWRGKSGSMSTKRMGGTREKHGQSTVRGQTRPTSNHMGGGSGAYSNVNLGAYANRRCGVKGK